MGRRRGGQKQREEGGSFLPAPDQLSGLAVGDGVGGGGDCDGNGLPVGLPGVGGGAHSSVLDRRPLASRSMAVKDVSGVGWFGWLGSGRKPAFSSARLTPPSAFVSRKRKWS